MKSIFKSTSEIFTEAVKDSQTALGKLLRQGKIIEAMNTVMYRNLPPEISKYCYIGSFNTIEQEAMIYITNQQIAHLIKGYENIIIDFLLKNNFPIKKLIFRISSKTHV